MLDLPPPGGPYASYFADWAWTEDESQVAILLELWVPDVPKPHYELTWLITFTGDDVREAVKEMIRIKTELNVRLRFWFREDPTNPSGLEIIRSEWVEEDWPELSN